MARAGGCYEMHANDRMNWDRAMTAAKTHMLPLSLHIFKLIKKEKWGTHVFYVKSIRNHPSDLPPSNGGWGDPQCLDAVE